ncbi:MAG TPA: FAD-dependent oxidoreductase [Pyrinomonadaceae bacterium]|nr:FAD-dependent oxidoreductase [Pyrinomonadaceae bacterium]
MLASKITEYNPRMQSVKRYDVAVIGAGVFGVWTAYQLNRVGTSVLLLDGYGPGNSRASSGGESRIMRLGYGPDEIYTRSAQRSLKLWEEFFAQCDGATPLFHRTGVLWLARESDAYCEATLKNLLAVGARAERLNQDELSARFPQMKFDGVDWAVHEVDAGVIMARRAVQAVALKARANGVDYLEEAVAPPIDTQNLRTISGKQIAAEHLVFACGPWLPKLFPDLLGERIHVTRQEVFFLGVPPGSDLFKSPQLPTWVDFNDLVYGMPALDGRGAKLAIDAHGPEFDPDRGDRIVSAESAKAVREYLARRLPMLADAPVTETRVCQYENTSNGDFLIDRHPAFENVWLAGGGSGHGFKHGPAVGEYVTAMITGNGTAEPRFSLATKEKVQERKVY